jgi:pre-mRNA-splicing factor 38B
LFSELHLNLQPYLQDEEEIDPKAGGGQSSTIGTMLKQFLMKLDWFGCLFPRIPVPIQKQIEKRLEDYHKEHGLNEPAAQPRYPPQQQAQRRDAESFDERRGHAGSSVGSHSRERDREYRGERSVEGRYRHDEQRSSKDHERHSSRKHSHEKSSRRDRSQDRERVEYDRYGGDREYDSGKRSSSSSHKKHHRERDHESRRYRDWEVE